ncbi:MAG: HEAT repeat domain-containing protein [Planctomycetota bacterium]
MHWKHILTWTAIAAVTTLLAVLLLSVFSRLADPRPWSGARANPAGATGTDDPAGRTGPDPATSSRAARVRSPESRWGDDKPLPETVDGLLEAFDHVNAPRRVMICGRLGELLAANRTAETPLPDAPSVIRQLTQRVETDSASIVRVAALDALTQIVPPADQSAMLVGWLDHSDSAVRVRVLRLVAQLGDAVILGQLLERLRQPAYTPRWLLIDAVAAMKVPACAPDLARLATDPTQPRDDRIRALAHLANFHSETVARDAIIRCARDRDPDVAAVARALR